jgi:hypothetical protein
VGRGEEAGEGGEVNKPALVREFEKLLESQGIKVVDVTEWRCDMRTKLVGDGCHVCNPEYAKDHSSDTWED